MTENCFEHTVAQVRPILLKKILWEMKTSTKTQCQVHSWKKMACCHCTFLWDLDWDQLTSSSKYQTAASRWVQLSVTVFSAPLSPKVWDDPYSRTMPPSNVQHTSRPQKYMSQFYSCFNRNSFLPKRRLHTPWGLIFLTNSSDSRWLIQSEDKLKALD